MFVFQVQKEQQKVAKVYGSILAIGVRIEYANKKDFDRGLDFFKNTLKFDLTKTNDFTYTLGRSKDPPGYGWQGDTLLYYSKPKYRIPKGGQEPILLFSVPKKIETLMKKPEAKKAITLSTVPRKTKTPDFHLPFHCNADSYKGYDDINAALRYWDKEVKSNPKNAEAYFNRGAAKYDLKDYKGAKADNDMAIKLKPDYARAYFQSAYIQFELEETNYKGMVKDCDMAIKFNPAYAEAYVIRGFAKYNLGKYAEAWFDFSMAIGFKPNDMHYLLNRASLEYMQNNYKGMLADSELAIKRDPANPKIYLAYHSRGVAKYMLKDYRGAEQDFKTAKKLGFPSYWK